MSSSHTSRRPQHRECQRLGTCTAGSTASNLKSPIEKINRRRLPTYPDVRYPKARQSRASERSVRVHGRSPYHAFGLHASISKAGMTSSRRRRSTRLLRVWALAEMSHGDRFPRRHRNHVGGRSFENDEWTPDSETGLLLQPFWRSARVEYRQTRTYAGDLRPQKRHIML